VGARHDRRPKDGQNPTGPHQTERKKWARAQTSKTVCALSRVDPNQHRRERGAVLVKPKENVNRVKTGSRAPRKRGLPGGGGRGALRREKGVKDQMGKVNCQKKNEPKLD